MWKPRSCARSTWEMLTALTAPYQVAQEGIGGGRGGGDWGWVGWGGRVTEKPGEQSDKQPNPGPYRDSTLNLAPPHHSPLLESREPSSARFIRLLCRNQRQCSNMGRSAPASDSALDKHEFHYDHISSAQRHHRSGVKASIEQVLRGNTIY